jgi:hypothetical protein
MAISFGNMIVGGVSVNESSPTPVSPKRTEIARVVQSQETIEESHVKLKDGELERLVPKKSSYMMDLTLGSE